MNKRARKNWFKLRLRLILFLSFEASLTDPDIDRYTRKKTEQRAKPLKWFETGKWTFHPENPYLRFWLSFNTLVQLIQLFTIPYICSFKFCQLLQFSLFENFADFCSLITMLLHFFTQIEIKESNSEQKFICDNRLIALQYMQGQFFIQLLCFAPTLCTYNRSPYFYWFKWLKLLYVHHTTDLMNSVGHFIKQFIASQHNALEAVQRLSLAMIYLCLLGHYMTCLWIMQGLKDPTSGVYIHQNNWNYVNVEMLGGYVTNPDEMY